MRVSKKCQYNSSRSHFSSDIKILRYLFIEIVGNFKICKRKIIANEYFLSYSSMVIKFQLHSLVKFSLTAIKFAQSNQTRNLYSRKTIGMENNSII